MKNPEFICSSSTWVQYWQQRYNQPFWLCWWNKTVRFYRHSADREQWMIATKATEFVGSCRAGPTGHYLAAGEGLTGNQSNPLWLVLVLVLVLVLWYVEVPLLWYGKYWRCCDSVFGIVLNKKFNKKKAHIAVWCKIDIHTTCDICSEYL